MSYVKQTWVKDETITAVKLNHMEDGIAAAGSGGGGIEAYDFDQAVNTDEGYLYGDVISYIIENTPNALKTGMIYTGTQYLYLTTEVYSIDDQGQPAEKEGGCWSGVTFSGDSVQFVIRSSEVVFRNNTEQSQTLFYYDSATNRWLPDGA